MKRRDLIKCEFNRNKKYIVSPPEAGKQYEKMNSSPNIL